MPQPSGLLCFDLDGTLVKKHGTPNSRFHPRFLDYLAELRSAGFLWVINSGRSLNSIIGALSEYRIRLLPDFIIARESEIYRQGQLGRWEDFGDWNISARDDQRRFIKTHSRVFKRLKKAYSGDHARFIESDDGQLSVITRSSRAMDTLCENMASISDTSPDFGYQRNGIHLRFTHSSYHKGTALKELCRMVNVAPLHVFIAGDNDNDLPMLDTTYGARLACPANAIDRVKKTVLQANGYAGTAEASIGIMQALDFYYFRSR